MPDLQDGDYKAGEIMFTKVSRDALAERFCTTVLKAHRKR
jgi:hypothetical protein